MTPADNVRLNDLMFKALDHALWCVHDGELLVPFVMTEGTLTRFVAERVEEGKTQAEKFLAEQTNEPVIVLAYDGYLTRDGVKNDAIFIQAFDKTEEKGVLLAQRYQHKTRAQSFLQIGNPAIVAYLDNPLFQK
jgi:hypothetical protein